MPRELREMMAAVAPTAALAPCSAPGTARLHTISDTSVIVSLAAWFFLRRLQMIFGPMRRRSGSWLVQYGAMAAYYLPTPLLLYASSTVYSSTSDNKAVLATYCSMCLMSSAHYRTVVMTAYTLGDVSTSPLQRWRLLPWLLYFLWMQFDFSGKGREWTPANLLYFTFLVVCPVVIAIWVSLRKSHVAKLEYETKAFADYMPLLVSKFRSSSSGSSLLVHHGRLDDDNDSLQQGCEYPFKQKDDGTWVTVKDLPRQDQDTFLSYSFCRLLARRYFRFACVEQGDAEVRNLVLTTQLLSSAGYKRAFSLVEVQLAFLHDHFFTDYPSKLRIRGLVGLLIALLICSGLGGVSVGTVLVYLKFFGRGHVSFSPMALVPILGIALFIALVLAVVSLLTVLPDYYLMLPPNYWHPVRQLSIKGYPTAATGTTADVDSSTPAPTSGWHSLLRYYCCCCCQGRSKKQGSCYYWRNKMGQYSLLADYDHSSLKKACINWFEQRLRSPASPGFIKHHPTAEDDVRVPDSVRRLVALTLQQHMMSGLPTKGTASLWRNRDLVPGGDLLWTCEQATSHTQIILLWHIATCYCDMFPVAVAEMEEEARDHHEVATALSKYCAYLVAFLPQFLPGQRLTSVVELQNVLQSAKDIIGQRSTWRRISMEEKLSKIQGLELPEDCPNLTGTSGSGNTTIHKGIYLGRQLMELDDASVRWKVMAEFWAETILYVAPSDDAAAHFEHLAKGGEFVTHLWAMLSNAGILQRAPDDPTPPPPQQQHGGVQPASSVAAAGRDQRFRRSLSLPI